MLLTLGASALTGGALARPRALMLLTYLSLEGPTDRTTLRTLLWGHGDAAANSFRVALSNIRAAVPGALHEQGLMLSSTLECDAVLLLRAAQQEQHQEALELYKGPFMPHWREVGTEIDEWWTSTRDYLALRTAQAALALGDAQARSGSWAQGAVRARQAQLLLGENGPAALRQRIYTLLRAAADVDAETLADQPELKITSCSPQQARAGYAQRRWMVPSPLDALCLGREAELTWLAGHLPTTRLISVTGLSGSGKTRLVETALMHPGLDAHFDELVWVPSDGAAGAVLTELLLRTLGLEPGSDPQATLAQHWAGRRVLLTLDHLAPDPATAALIESLLGSCPQLQVLITAPAPLRLGGEQVLMLGGFVLATPILSQGHPALQLLVQTAGRAGQPLAVTPDALGHLSAVCHRLRGLPLALRLAGHLARLLSPEQLREALDRSADVLEIGPAPDVRHSGIRAIWQTTLDHLSTEERRAVTALGAVRGAITHETVAALGVSFALLSRLHDFGVLETTAVGVFEWHPLLANAARRHGQPEDIAAAQDGLAAHLLSELARRQGHWHTPDAQIWLSRQWPNLLQTVEWGLHHQAAKLADALGSLLSAFELSARYQAGLDHYRHWLSVLPEHSLWGPLLTMQAAWLAFRTGQLSEARSWTQDTLDKQPPLAICMQLENILACVATEERNGEVAEYHCRRALDYSLVLNDLARQAIYLGNLANIQMLREHYEDSASSLGRALGLPISLSLHQKTVLLNQWAYLQIFCLEQGQLRETRMVLAEHLQRTAEAGETPSTELLIYLAHAQFELAERSAAVDAARRAHGATREGGVTALMLAAQLVLGRSLGGAGDVAESLRLLGDATEQARTRGLTELMVDGLLFFAEVCCAQQDSPNLAWLGDVQAFVDQERHPFQTRLLNRLLTLTQPAVVTEASSTLPMEVWQALMTLRHSPSAALTGRHTNAADHPPVEDHPRPLRA